MFRHIKGNFSNDLGPMNNENTNSQKRQEKPKTEVKSNPTNTFVYYSTAKGESYERIQL